MLNKYSSLIVTLTASLLSFSAQASNEHNQIWYSTSLGNQLEINTTFGCIDADMMYEKHIIKANTWNGTWSSSDSDYMFAYYANGLGYSTETPVIAFNTSEVHLPNGSTIDANGDDITHTVYIMRKYVPIYGRKDRASSPYWGILNNLSIDLECSVL